jgi:hypothetical protein
MVDLFEPHENDWYKDGSLTLPESFFTNLYDHFEEFNFTTDESSPEYEQIAIDPEMLGRVFESLLATQIDDTGSSGYVKPRVHSILLVKLLSYMCRGSRSGNYLYNELPLTMMKAVKESIDSLLDISDSEWAKVQKQYSQR